MLTIKHINKETGVENVVFAHSVTYVPARADADPGQQRAVVCGYSEHEIKNRFFDGRIFVMNENGRTVADYDLGLPARE